MKLSKALLRIQILNSNMIGESSVDEFELGVLLSRQKMFGMETFSSSDGLLDFRKVTVKVCGS